MNFYYVENTLNTKQMNIENSRTMLEKTLNAASNTFVAVEGNGENLKIEDELLDKIEACGLDIIWQIFLI